MGNHKIYYSMSLFSVRCTFGFVKTTKLSDYVVDDVDGKTLFCTSM
jgi:hypothetical protein